MIEIESVMSRRARDPPSVRQRDRERLNLEVQA